MRTAFTFVAMLATCPAALAQVNLLGNPSFDLSTGSIQPCENCVAASCDGNFQVWQRGSGTSTQRDGNVGRPPCVSAAYASIQGDTPPASVPNGKYYYQNVTGLTPGQTYTMTGLWAATNQGGPPSTFSVEVHQGTSAADVPNSLLGSQTLVLNSNVVRNFWSTFAFNVTLPPAVSSITVVARMMSVNVFSAYHLDEFRLFEATCLTLPTISSITPDHAAENAGTTHVTIAGTGFNTGTINEVSLQRPGDSPILGINIQVAPDGLSLTADFNMSVGVNVHRNGRWNVVVGVTDCPAATLVSGFLIILGSLQNGDFSLATLGSVCAQDNVAPAAWLFSEQAGWGSGLARNTPRYMPTCDTAPFGSSITPPAPNYSPVYASATGWETIPAVPSTSYTVTARFAGGGNHRTFLRLHDGDENGAVLGAMTVQDGEPIYPWRPAVVTGTPTKDYMTVAWQALANASDVQAIHMDEFVVGTCASPITVGGLTPAQGLNNAVLSGASITGSGFSGTPTVIVTKQTGQIIAVSNVSVVNPGLIHCDLDLNGAASGPYDVIVIQGNCTATLTAALHVVAIQFTNGSFNLPAASSHCGTRVAGLPVGWSTSTEVLRDGERPGVLPTCPRAGDDTAVFGDPPNNLHSHYGSMYSANGVPQQAWQTIHVTPGKQYQLKGQFAGVGDNTLRIRLLSGDEFGAPLATHVVSSGVHSSDWSTASVQAVATTDTMTVLCEMTDFSGPGPHAAYADGLSFGIPCSDPFADADGDDDVDGDDFGILQRCYTFAPMIPLPEDCRCLDRGADNNIEQTELLDFMQCASGPNLPANPCCDGGCQ